MKNQLSRRQFALELGALSLSSTATGLFAQTQFPTRPVTLIVPNAPGGAFDILARMLQQQLQTVWSQPVLVEYKAGANSVLGTEFTAKATPNGHTICIVATGHVINPALRQLPFDTVSDLSGITLLGASNILISASPNFPANNLKQAIALIKANPGKFSYATPGTASAMHLAMELLKQTAGLDLLHVPFKGSGPAYPEVIAGRVNFMVDPLFSSVQLVKGGKLKPLASTALRRSPLLPDVEAVSETVPGFNVNGLFGLVVASGTPRDVVGKIHDDIVTIMQRSETQEKMSELGLHFTPTTPEKFDAMIKSDIDKWSQVVKKAQLKME